MKAQLALQPSYQHDCDKCIFIASVYMFNQVVDLWTACGESEKYYIVRYSSEGSEYSTVHNYYPDNPVMGCSLDTNPSGRILSYNYEVIELIEKKVIDYLSKIPLDS